MTIRILRGDVRDRLRDLPDESVHCVVTSPPYFGLRDYGVKGQIGLEATPTQFVAALVGIFAEVRRVLRKDGTCWLNMGDSYAGSWGAQSRGDDYPGALEGGSTLSARQIAAHPKRTNTGSLKNTPGLKPKDLMMVPARLAIALQKNGWWVRQDIIWHKPNPMPESIKDRCTKAHEYIFLLTRSPIYYFDHEAIMEPAEKAGRVVHSYNTGAKDRKDANEVNDRRTRIGLANWNEAVPENRFCRSVWTITTKGYSEAHFATFPPDLPERCILAGCPVGGTVLDPFGGAGTTGLVADRLQRDAILIEINPEYADMAERRIRGDSPLFAQVGT